MLARMFALAILGISEPHCRCGLISGGPIVPHIGPQPGRFGLALAGSQHRNRRIIGVYFRSCHDVPSDLIDQRREQLTGRTYPSGQSGTAKVHSVAFDFKWRRVSELFGVCFGTIWRTTRQFVPITRLSRAASTTSTETW